MREGNRIDITLKATRGEEGSTAVIDIVPDNTVAVGQGVITPAATAQTSARPVLRGLSQQRSSAAASSPEPEVVAEAAGQASSGDAQGDTATATATGDVAQGEADQAATGTDSAQGSARPTGLFAHLKKPAATTQVSES